MQIRELRAEDVPAVARIEAEVFSEPWTERDFLEMVKADYAHYYVAEEAGEITGYCGLRNMAGEGEITNVAVAPLFRRREPEEGSWNICLRKRLLVGLVTVPSKSVPETVLRSVFMKVLGSVQKGSDLGFMKNPGKMH